MNVLLLMIPMAILFGMIFIAFFILSVKSGQYDDLDTPASRLLIDEEAINTQSVNLSTEHTQRGGSHGQH